MTEKFSLEDLFMKIMPGGVMIGVLFFVYGDLVEIKLIKGLDFFYTFVFFTFSYLMGEVLQTIAHQFEWIVFVFFKFYKPSEIFLYKSNPVLKGNEDIRKQLLQKLSLDSASVTFFDTEYKQLPLVWWKRMKQDKAQNYFWTLYHNVSSENEIKAFNRSYIFVRAVIFIFIILAVLFGVMGNYDFMFLSIALFILFLWRARGMSRGLVFKTVMLNLKS